jgi:hypothetical protein
MENKLVTTSLPPADSFKQPEKQVSPPESNEKFNSMESKLIKPFKPCQNLPTPNIESLVPPYEPTTPFLLETQNPHSRDGRIVSLDNPHTYFLDGTCEHVLSVTTFTHAFFAPFDREVCAESMLNGKTFKSCVHRPSYKYHGCQTKQDIFKRWTEWQELGTDLHENIELFLNDEPFVVQTLNERPWQHFEKLLHDKVWWTWSHYRTEWAVFDAKTQIAGMIDYCGMDPRTGKIIILDWKRVGYISDTCMNRFQGKEPQRGTWACADFDNCKYVLYSLQLNVYKWILESNYGFKVSKMFLVQLHPSLTAPVLYKVPNLQWAVKKMVECRLSVFNVVNKKRKQMCSPFLSEGKEPNNKTDIEEIPCTAFQPIHDTL